MLTHLTIDSFYISRCTSVHLFDLFVICDFDYKHLKSCFLLQKIKLSSNVIQFTVVCVMASVNALVHVVTASIVLLLVCEYSSAQDTGGGCNPTPPVTLVSGVGTLSNGVPSISSNSPGEKILT